MRCVANTTAELVPEPPGQSQARPQEANEPVQHDNEPSVWTFTRARHA
jgi:hypothetical protein